MPTRYFKKATPKTALILTNGTPVPFMVVDHTVGIRAIDDPVIQDQFDLAIRRQSGGITEITIAEYNELLEKKNAVQSQPPPWREEWSKATGLQSPIHPPSPASPVATVEPPPEAGGFKPSTKK